MIALHKFPVLNLLFNRGSRNRSLYTDRSEVMEEFNRRRDLEINDAQLLEVIKPTPSIEKLLKTPHLIFFRQVATPLHETIEVIQLAKVLGLELCILEYGDDKLVSAHNFYKLGLGKLPIFKLVDKTGRDIYQNQTIIDFNTYSGKPLKDVYTLKGERLMDFHHELLEDITGINPKDVTLDASDWFAQFNNNAAEYYEAFFTLFVKHNVLAEVFLSKGADDENFTARIVNPAYNIIQAQYGLNPLIVNYQPGDEQTRIYWDCYPGKVNEFLRKKGYIE